MKEKLKKLKQSRLVTLIGILLFIAVCIGIGAGMAYVEHESDPTDEAVAYFRAFMQGNYDKMYTMIDQEDGTYISREMYCSMMKQIRQNLIVESYEIDKPKKEDGRYLVTIECIDNQTNSSQDFKIYLNQKRRGLQLIPDYVINIDDMLVEDFSVVLSKDNHLELNGEEIQEDMAESVSEEDGNKTYYFKAALNGAYKVAAVNDFATIYENIHLTKKNTKVELTGSRYTANDSYAKQLQKSGNRIIRQFYQAVRNKDSADKKLLAQMPDKKLKNQAKKLVEESEEIIFWPERKNIENYKVTEFELKNMSNTIRYYPKKNIYVVTYTYNYDYQASTDTALYTSYVYMLSGRCSSKMTLTYTLEKNQIILFDIRLNNKNKKKE